VNIEPPIEVETRILSKVMEKMSPEWLLAYLRGKKEERIREWRYWLAPDMYVWLERRRGLWVRVETVTVEAWQLDNREVRRQLAARGIPPIPESLLRV
jgi:hypothetical protein